MRHTKGCRTTYSIICSQEYEAGETAEARFVKGQTDFEQRRSPRLITTGLDLDRIEMALQATEYETRHGIPLQSFFDGSLPKVRHPEIQEWANDIQKEREEHLK
jgi:putative hydrolase of HD superfamily